MDTEKFIRHHENQQKAHANSVASRATKPEEPTNNAPEPLSDSDSSSSSKTSTEPFFPEPTPTIRHDIKALSPYEVLGS